MSMKWRFVTMLFNCQTSLTTGIIAHRHCGWSGAWPTFSIWNFSVPPSLPISSSPILKKSFSNPTIVPSSGPHHSQTRSSAAVDHSFAATTPDCLYPSTAPAFNPHIVSVRAILVARFLSSKPNMPSIRLRTCDPVSPSSMPAA